MRKVALLMVAFVTLASTPCSAQVRLLLPEIANLIVRGGDGPYQKALRVAFERAKVEVATEVVPKARALERFFSGEGDGIFTFTQTARQKLGAAAVIASYPLGAYRGYVFTPGGTAAVTDFARLSRVAVGGVLGFEGTYGAVLRAGALLELVNSDDQNLKKLAAGRVKAILGFLPDLTEAAAGLSYAADKPFFESYDRLTLRNTPANRALLDRLSPVLAAMHRDGTIAGLVGPGYLPVAGTFSPDR